MLSLWSIEADCAVSGVITRLLTVDIQQSYPFWGPRQDFSEAHCNEVELITF